MPELPQAVTRLETEVHEVRQKLDGHVPDTRAQFEKVNIRLGNLEE